MADASRARGLALELLRDDGAAVYLNGRELLRNNLPGGRLRPTTRAPMAIGSDREDERIRLTLPPDLLASGANVLAAAVYQHDPASEDLRFELALVLASAAEPPRLVRGPYLQQVTGTGAVVRFGTSRLARGRVRYGAAPDALAREVLAEAEALDHELALPGLAPGSRVYYAVGTTEGDLAGGDADHVFSTAPPADAPTRARIWVTGDPGTATAPAHAVRDAYLAHAGERPAELWLTLGDNAYPSGTPSELQANFFDLYAAVLRRTALWPALGNHDLEARDPLRGGFAYFHVFTLPEAGEAGGAPSGSEHYYSFDWGRIHVVVLDSAGSHRGAEGPMLQWLRQDLATYEGDWLLAAFHHAPASRGTHHDGREQSAAAMRQLAVPLLEAAGVDLVLAGHNHNYERSYLLRGPHPGRWAFEPMRIESRASGRREAGEAYRKGPGGSDGAVYVVAGSAGQTGEAPLDHPAMAVSLAIHGSVVVDIDGCRLDAVFVDEAGVVRDGFGIEKAGCGAPSSNER